MARLQPMPAGRCVHISTLPRHRAAAAGANTGWNTRANTRPSRWKPQVSREALAVSRPVDCTVNPDIIVRMPSVEMMGLEPAVGLLRRPRSAPPGRVDLWVQPTRCDRSCPPRTRGSRPYADPARTQRGPSADQRGPARPILASRPLVPRGKPAQASTAVIFGRRIDCLGTKPAGRPTAVDQLT